MKKALKKTLKWTGISLLVIITLLILIPIIFKDQIKQMVIDEVNTNLNAKLSIDDFDLTFISTFPNMTVEIHDARLTGLKEFKGVELMKIKTLTAHVGFWSVIGGDQVEIDEIHIDQPIIDVRILENGMANYDIVKPDSEKTKEEIEEPSSFKLSLKKYTITNARIKYDDRASNMYAELINVNHSGSGDLSADVVDFETTTSMDKLTYRMDGINYLTEVETDADINLLMKFTDKSSKFTLKKNTISLNKVDLSLDGYYEMFEGYDDMNIKLDASQSSFKDFLSLIPTFYHSGYESMVSSGSMSLNGLVKGKMDEKNMPSWDFGVKLKNGSIKYPGLSKITNVQVDAASKFPGGKNLDDMTFDMPKFHANLSKNTIDGSLFMKRLLSDPYIESSINSHVDLATLKDFIPMEKGEEYSGILDANVDVKGRVIALENGDYENFTAKGILELSQMKYKTESISEDVDINHLKLTFSPVSLALNELDAKMGKSDFQMDGDIRNYFGYLFREGTLEGDFNLNSNFIDVDELMGVYPEEETAPAVAGKRAAVAKAETEEPTLVPANIDFKMSTKINKARYNGIDAKNLTGKIVLKDEIAELTNFDLSAMGGDIALSGSYNTQDHENPKFDFGYILKGIDIQELTKNFLTIEKLAPIAKYAKGKISSSF
ncbi:MAG: AsmA family protein, partial [Crocinitomicaceae bacterium]|nr:AsmA family protein [Crocinitomicaceae bacterium]